MLEGDRSLIRLSTKPESYSGIAFMCKDNDVYCFSTTHLFKFRIIMDVNIHFFSRSIRLHYSKRCLRPLTSEPTRPSTQPTRRRHNIRNTTPNRRPKERPRYLHGHHVHNKRRRGDRVSSEQQRHHGWRLVRFDEKIRGVQQDRRAAIRRSHSLQTPAKKEEGEGNEGDEP